MILRDAQNFKKLDSVHKWEYQEKARIEKKTCPLKKGMVKAVADWKVGHQWPPTLGESLGSHTLKITWSGDMKTKKLHFSIPCHAMGRLYMYLHEWWDFYGFHVRKYTIVPWILWWENNWFLFTKLPGGYQLKMDLYPGYRGYHGSNWIQNNGRWKPSLTYLNDVWFMNKYQQKTGYFTWRIMPVSLRG